MANSRQEARTVQALQNTTRRAAEDMRRSAEDGTRRASENAEHVSRSALDAGERVALSGTEILQRNAQIMWRAWQSYLDFTTQATGRSNDEFARIFPLGSLMAGGDDTRKAAEQASRAVGAVVDSSNVLTKGAEDIAREWFDFARSRVEQNLSSFGELTRSRSPHQFAAVQTEAVRDNLESLLQASRKIAEISMRIADDAMGRMNDAAERGARAV
jgi:phasin family protein